MKRKRTILSWIAIICLFVGTNMMPIYATGTASHGQDSQNDTIVAPDGMGIDSGSYTGTEFTESYSLTKSNGAKVNFWINNNGSVAVKITINGEHERIIPPGENGHISASVAAPDKTCKFKAVPTPNGGKISIDFRIAQRDEGEIASGSHSGTQFVDTYSLTKSNGAKVNFWISNKGSVSVRITINGKEGKTIAPGKSGFISASVGTSSKDYKFEAVPTPNGGDINIDYRIAQRRAEQ